MITIPPAKDTEDKNPNIEASGYPKGYLQSLNSAYVPKVNLDKVLKSESQQTSDTFKYGIPRIALGAFTELAAAMPGISDEEATSMAKSFTPDNVYKDFLDNKEGSQLVGSLGLSLVPILGMTKLMKSKKVFSAVQKVLGTRAATVILPNQISMMERTASFKKKAMILAGKQQRTFNPELANVKGLEKMRKAMINSEMLDTVKIGLGTDAGIYAVANESDFMFPEEMSSMELAAFYGIPNLVVGGMSGMVVRYGLKNVLRDVGPIAAARINNVGLPLDTIISNPGNRWNFTTTLSSQKAVKTREFAEASDDSVLAGNLNSQVMELDAGINTQVQLMAKDSPIEGVTKSWDISDKGFNTIKSSMDSDFAVLNQVVSLESSTARTAEAVLKDIKDTKLSVDNTMKKLYKEMDSQEGGSKGFAQNLTRFENLMQQKQTLDVLTPVKINTDGSMQLLANAKPEYDDILTGITRTNANPALIQKAVNKLKTGDILKTVDDVTETSMYSVKIKQGRSNVLVTATDDLKIILPETSTTKVTKTGKAGEKIDDTISNAKFGELSYKSKTAVQVVLRKAVENFDVEKAILNPLKPSAKMHHTEMDAVLELGDKLGKESDAAMSSIRFESNGISNFDDLGFASLNSKYQDFVTQMDTIGAQTTGVIKLKEFDKLKVEDIVRTLNLPNDGTTGLSPLAELFMDAYVNRTAKLSDKFSSLKAVENTLVKSAKPVSDIAMFTEKRTMQFRGEAFKTYENPREPVYAMLKANYENPVHRNDLITQAMADRFELVDGLKGASNEGAPLITTMTEAAMRDPKRFETAIAVDNLVEGSLPHKDKFTTVMWGADNQPVIIAVDSIRNEQDDIWKAYVAAKFKPHEQTFNRILSNDKEGDLISFNILVNQQGNGWRASTKLVPVEKDGKLIGYKMPLEKHGVNEQLYKKIYNLDEMPKEAFMPAPIMKKGDQPADLVISPLATEAAMAVNEISQDILKHINVLRKLAGKPAIAAKPFHMPAKNLQGKELIYLINKNTGELSTIKAANTPAQVNRLASEEIALAKKQGDDLFIATENEIANFNMIKSQAFVDMTDFSSSFVSTGSGAGKSFGQVIETGSEVLTRMQESLINQYGSVSKVTSSMIFQPQFRAAEFAAKTSGAQTSAMKKGEDIWSVWMNRATGQRSGNKNQAIGKLYGAAEEVYDTILQKLWDTKLAAVGGSQSVASGAKSFAALDKAVPDYNPFKDSMEYLENTMKIKAPHSAIKHASKLGNVMGLTMLRMFNVGLALVNIGTLPTLIPPVAAALARGKDETMAAWRGRIGAWSSIIDDDVAIWNPTKTFSNGMGFMFTDEWKQVSKKAAEKGHLWQKAVEEMQLFTLPQQGYMEKTIKKAAEFTSLITDRSETLSRSISYATFYNMGRKSLKMGEEASMDFAHFQVNKVIGDFRSNVRPQVYQGATGMPFSLFTTFALNYMQRVFGYVEKGQMKAFMNQMGLQTAFFGAKSLPGFNQYVEAFTSNYDGTENLVDRMNSSLGQEATDFFLNGSVGSLTGMAAYTKTSIPLPLSNYNSKDPSLLDFAPAVSMIKQTYTGIADSMKSIYANEGLNGRQLSEIASRTFPVRNLRGWFDLLNGVQVDKRGQVIDNNIYNAQDIFSRVSSIKTLRNQKTIEEFSRQRSTEMAHKEIRQQMRMSLRSTFRAGNLTPEYVNQMAKEWVRSDGDPKGFLPFLQDQAFTGLVDKAFARTLELATKKSKELEYMRMLEIISRDGLE